MPDGNSAPTSERRAYSIKALAAVWDCKPRTIYDMVASGELEVFHIGKGKRGMRVHIEEVERWERENKKTNDTATEGARSAGAKKSTLPTTAMRMVSASGRS